MKEVQAALNSSFLPSHPSQGHLQVARAPAQSLRTMRLCPEKSGNLPSETQRVRCAYNEKGNLATWFSDACFVLSLGMGAEGRDGEDAGFGLDLLLYFSLLEAWPVSCP